ncbi:MAG: TRL-like family protein [Deferribacteraceae bacterium]|jgi:hypothetical protein|nr:TRL-like family protein [Deferribacteraceae bacterium]
MKKVIIILALALCACTSTLGGVYGDMPEVAYGERGSKTGVSKCYRLFGINMSDCSIGAAMAEGQISELRTVESDRFNIIIYKSETTTITGE